MNCTPSALFWYCLSINRNFLSLLGTFRKYYSNPKSTQNSSSRWIQKPVVIFMRTTAQYLPLENILQPHKIAVRCMSLGRKYELPSYFRTIEWHCCDNDWIYDKHSQCITSTVNIILLLCTNKKKDKQTWRPFVPKVTQIISVVVYFAV